MKIIKIFFISVFLLFFLSIGALILGVEYAKQQVESSVSDDTEERVFVIKSGETLEDVASSLEAAGLVKDKSWFWLYIYYRGWSTKLQAGEYSLAPSLSVAEIADRITGGDVVFSEVKVTIPEGFTLKQIDERFSAAGLIKPGSLLEYQELEGYLFPDTYIFDTSETLDEIIEKMRDNFEKKIDHELRNDIADQDKSLKDIITMASIIEREVPNYDERQIVSGIFWNRVNDHYPLQSCATIAYALGVDKWRYSIEDTKIDSPYNTYQNKGLPPGPIGNPGLSAIRAAIYPEDTDYYFFLSTKDGVTIFSKTLEEHNANKAKYLE